MRLDYARYLAEVRDLDTGFGMIMHVLAQRGLNENTLVIFMGDNGEALLRGKGTLYSRGLHVPLIVRWPGKVQAGSQSDALISGVDLAATMLDAAGVAPAGGVVRHQFSSGALWAAVRCAAAGFWGEGLALRTDHPHRRIRSFTLCRHEAL